MGIEERPLKMLRETVQLHPAMPEEELRRLKRTPDSWLKNELIKRRETKQDVFQEWVFSAINAQHNELYQPAKIAEQWHLNHLQSAKFLPQTPIPMVMVQSTTPP